MKEKNMQKMVKLFTGAVVGGGAVLLSVSGAAAFQFDATTNVYCDSSLRDYVGEVIGAGFESVQTDNVFMAGNLCQDTLAVVDETTWTGGKADYNTVVGGFLPSGVTGDAAWTSTAGGDGMVMAIAAADGSTTATAVTSDLGAVPTVMLSSGACEQQGNGTVGSPYVLGSDNCPGYSPGVVELDDQVAGADIAWNQVALSPDQGSFGLSGVIKAVEEAKTYEIKLELVIDSEATEDGVVTYTTAAAAEAFQDASFSFEMPVSVFGASLDKWTFPGPQKLTITDEKGVVTLMDWNVSFYFPIYDQGTTNNRGDYIYVY